MATPCWRASYAWRLAGQAKIRAMADSALNLVAGPPAGEAAERTVELSTERTAKGRAMALAPERGRSCRWGGDGGVGGSAMLVNNYDGARATTVSLDVGWKFHLGDVSGAQATTFDDSSWTAVDVPHDWSISLPFNQSSPASYGGGYLDGGIGWYRKSFTLPASSSGQRVLVQFDGVYMDSTVWLNGTQVCARPYGYSSFECDFTSSAKFGASNVLAVKVNNQQPSSRWYSGSGIYRHVWLKTVNPVRVAYTGTRVTTPQVSATSATVNIAVTVQNDAASDQSVTVTSSVRDAAGTEVGKATSAATSVAAGKTADVTQTVTVSNPKLWSTRFANPVLRGHDRVRGRLRRRHLHDPIRHSYLRVRREHRLLAERHEDEAQRRVHAPRPRQPRRGRQLSRHREASRSCSRTWARTPFARPTTRPRPSCSTSPIASASSSWMRRSTAGTTARTRYDYGRFFRQWANTDITDMVARDLQSPERHHLEHRQRGRRDQRQTTVTQLMDAIKTKDTTRPIGQAFAAWAQADTPAVGTGRRRGNQLRAGSLRLDSHGPPHLEDVRQRIVVGVAESRDLQQQQQPVLVLRRLRGRLGRTPRKRRGRTSTRGPGLPASSSGPASTTSASQRPTRGPPRARTSEPSTPRTSRRTSSTSIRASGTRVGPPWSTSFP